MKGWLVADIGGTKLSAAVYDGEQLLAREQIATRAEEGSERVLKRLADLLKNVSRNTGIEPIGLGVVCPGPLSSSKGIVKHAPLLQWHNVPVVEILQSSLAIPAVLENDANAAALGEQRYGAGKGAESIAYITVSTGIGCGIVLNGKILKGKHESAGELGHLVIVPDGEHCVCGRNGCLEMYASGTAIAREARKIIASRGKDGHLMDAKEAAQLAREGDFAFQKLFQHAGTALGRSIAALLQILDIERIVIGGSVSESMDLLRLDLLKAARSESYWADGEDWLYMSALHPDAGLYGAACIAKDVFSIKR